MDPATLSFFLTYGVPLLTALGGIVIKHYVPSLGSAFLPGGSKPASSPATTPAPLLPVTPSSSNAVRHPLLGRLLQSANGQGFLSEILAGVEQTAVSVASQPAGQPSPADQILAALAAQLTKAAPVAPAAQPPVIVGN